ncbi:DUF294 nucleotidyltransferase-like domain-containing protein [Metabacillus iocasae]|uniref:CBS domain-containing protein n=1 Tax=Priestia iocasae TaxID=2291674 RepID=A0ABS2QX82_9BACI|nr:DUF294 nucleotidyltransferase-like domain-containing protein [Metabacillus iocasae]MBM7704027.1 CBS domain-containing protein [Metabacillus iocasae]
MDQTNKCNHQHVLKVKGHPLFQGLSEEEMVSLLQDCQIKSYQSHQNILFETKQQKGLLLLLHGIAEVYVKDRQHEREEVLEVVREGQLIGFPTLADFLNEAEIKYQEDNLEVRTLTEAEALLIPFSVIENRWQDEKVKHYLLTQVSIRLKGVYQSLAEQIELASSFGEKDSIILRVQEVMSDKVISASPVMSIHEVSKRMIDHNISSVVVIDNHRLVGIVTEKDLVKRVITERRSVEEAVETIMTPEPVTVSRFSYYYEALAMMLLRGIKHLPVTDEGQVVGVVSLSDLLRKKNENMIRVIHQIDQADSSTLPVVKEAAYEIIQTLIHHQVPVLSMLDILTKLYDRLVKRCIELALQDLEKQGKKQPAPFCFYQMGSSGRKEQFLLTDQDHFLVYQGDNHDYFKMLSERIVKLLEQAGYERCKGNMMASNHIWRGSVGQWDNRIRSWTLESTNEVMLNVQNFFSYRLLYGNESIHQAVDHLVQTHRKKAQILLYRLAELEKTRPIPSIHQRIRSLLHLERKQIDLKKEVLFPYHHALQILAASHDTLHGSPLEQVDRLVQKGVLTASFAEDIKKAIETILERYVQLKWRQFSMNEEKNSILSFHTLTIRQKDELIWSLKTLKELQSKMLLHFSI